MFGSAEFVAGHRETWIIAIKAIAQVCLFYSPALGDFDCNRDFATLTRWQPIRGF